MIVIMPADDADRTPLWESSNSKHRRGPLGGFKKGIGRGLSPLVVALSDDLVKSTQEIVCGQMSLNGSMRGRRGDGAGKPELIERVEQFERARLQREAGDLRSS